MEKRMRPIYLYKIDGKNKINLGTVKRFKAGTFYYVNQDRNNEILDLDLLGPACLVGGCPIWLLSHELIIMREYKVNLIVISHRGDKLCEIKMSDFIENSYVYNDCETTLRLYYDIKSTTY